MGDWFTAETGNRQDDPISPLLFISLLESWKQQNIIQKLVALTYMAQ